jgi:hypothetical protein
MGKKALEESSNIYIYRKRDEIDIQTEAVCDFDSRKVINSSDGCFVAGMKKPWRSSEPVTYIYIYIYSFAISIECNDEKQFGNETGRAEERCRVPPYAHSLFTPEFIHKIYL